MKLLHRHTQSDTRFRLIPTSLCVVLTCTLLSALLPTAANAQEQPSRPTTLVPVANVDMNSAFTLARNVCNGAGMAAVRDADGALERYEERCIDVSVLQAENMLSITASLDVVERLKALLAEIDRAPLTRSFQIIVLSADSSGESGDVPPNVERALQDVRDFLPYTGFQVVGSGWLRTSRSAEATLPGPMNLIAELRFRPTTDPDAALLVERFGVYRRESMQVVDEGVAIQQMRNRSVLESTFTINPGETVVVGTSKLDGDDSAMVVLLTAVQN